MKYGVRFIKQEQMYMVTLNGAMDRKAAEAEKARLNAELQATNNTQVAGYDDGPLYCHYCGTTISDYRPTFGFFGEPACQECGGN